MLKSLFHLFYPRTCNCCSTSLDQFEKVICTQCRHDIPLTRFHHFNDITLKKVFYGRLQLELATALFYFEKKGPVQKLLHNLKYKRQEHLSTFIGEWLGHELSTISSYKTIDTVIPVPIHPKKLKSRGYNQVTSFGQVLAKHLNANFDEKTLIKSKNTATQVFKGRFTRGDEIQNAFSITDKITLSGKHILLVDDIITTGATIEACALELLQIPKIKLSIATMAIAT